MLENKKLLILGANPETAVLVNTAKSMGIYTIVTDYIPDSYAKKIADKAYDIDGLNVDELVAVAKEEKVDGVIVGTADPLIPSYYQVCQKLHLPCYCTEEAVMAFTNKIEFKKVCNMFGVQGVPEYSIEDVWKDKVNYPILVKPSDGRSGKGMSVCFSKEEVEPAVQKALAASRCKTYLLERYMECDDVFMYYTFIDGKYYLSAMSDRFTSKEQKGMDPVVLGAVYPSKYIELYQNTLHEKMCQVFQYLNIRNGVLLIQAFVENDQFYVYDPGFRLQGAAPHILLENINHFDQQKMLIQLALTGKMGDDIEEKNDVYFQGKIAASQVVLLKGGVIKKITGIEEVSGFPGVIKTTQRLFVGDEVSLIGTEQQILVRFHLVCETKDQLKSLVDKINHTVSATDSNDNHMCLQGLQPKWI